jgi:hypothetical protein
MCNTWTRFHQRLCRNFHFGRAKIIGFLEYIVERVNGTLLPPVDLPPRLSAKNKKKLPTFKNKENKNNENRFTILQDCTSTISSQDFCGNGRDKLVDNKYNISKQGIKHNPIDGSELDQPIHNRGFDKSFCCCQDQIKKAKIKLWQLEQLLIPFCHPQYVHALIESIISYCNASGDYEHIDRCLENHRTNIIEGRWHIYPK